MKASLLNVLLLPAACAYTSSVDTEVATVRRALPNSPLGYTPSHVDCPSVAPSVRNASTLSQNETEWLEKRRSNTIAPMRTLLQRLNITNFDAESYVNAYATNASALPNIGIAMSGGGWRALQNGAGALEAFDSRTPYVNDVGHLGGLLQSATYLAGLSGGSWLVGSLFMNNFTSVTALRDETTGSVWEFGNSVIEGPAGSGIQLFNTIEYYDAIVDDVEGKEDAGFEVTLTDVWGRALSFQLIGAADGGPKYTWSSIAETEAFQTGNTPFPLVIADERAPGVTLIPANTTVYEFSPFEMGTWDPTVFGFIPTQYLGTNFTSGIISSSSRCVVGFDNAGFVMGTSSSLFNNVLLSLQSGSLPSFVKTWLNKLLGAIRADNVDMADYSPNPFYRYNPSSNPSSLETTLHLVDGGEDNQNIPFHPLIQPVRNVDVIFAIDSSADTTHNWPNGSALVETYRRNLPSSAIANGTSFPSIPDTNTMINLGLNARPTFFGCNASNSTGPTPLIVYIPMAPYVTYPNVSTFDLSYNDTQRDAIILNGYNVATAANGTFYANYTMCVACAILSRSFHRTATPVPAACTACFAEFCWDGSLNSTAPAQYAPIIRLPEMDLTASIDMSTSSSSSSSSAAAPRLRASGLMLSFATAVMAGLTLCS